VALKSFAGLKMMRVAIFRWGRRNQERIINILMGFIYVYFMLGFGQDFVVNKRLSSLFYMVVQSVIAVSFLLRRPPVEMSWKKWDWFVALVGSFAPMLITPYNGPMQPFWLAMEILGVTVSVAGLLSLNSSFGIVAANRGVKTGGLYAFIRHPIYASYLVTDVAILAQNWSIGNALFIAVNVAAQVARIRAEEMVLMKDEQYRLHAEKVRWRVIPGVW